MAKAAPKEAGAGQDATKSKSTRPPFLHLERRIWTPILIVAALFAGWLRMLVRTPGQVQVDGQLASGAYFGGILGSALLPWVVALIASYGYWIWAKASKSRDFMDREFRPKQRRLMHGIVLFLVLLMGLHACSVVAVRLGLI